MSTKSGFGYNESYKAGADLRTAQYKIVKLSAENTVILTAAATDLPCGVLANKPNTNEGAWVRQSGRHPCMVDGSGTAIAVGDWVGPNNAGIGVKKATADYSTLGIALQAASAANVVISIDIKGAGFFRSAAG